MRANNHTKEKVAGCKPAVTLQIFLPSCSTRTHLQTGVYALQQTQRDVVSDESVARSRGYLQWHGQGVHVLRALVQNLLGQHAHKVLQGHRQQELLLPLAQQPLYLPPGLVLD